MANLLYTLQQNLSEIVTKRKELFSDWTKINDESEQDETVPYLALTLLDCGHFTFPTNRSIPKNVSADLPSSCSLCCFKSKLSNYESLFSRQSEDRVMNNVITMKSWTENGLVVIYEFAKKNNFTHTLLEDGQLHILQFRDLQNEIIVKKTFFALFYQLSSKIHLQRFISVALLEMVPRNR